MIDGFILYGILAGLLFRALHHNRLVVLGMAKRGFVYWVTESWLRVALMAVIVILGSRLHGVIPESYHLWWRWYFRDHSLGVWILLPCTLTVALYLLLAITFATNTNPHEYKMYDEGTGQPTFLRTNMQTPAVWFVAFWGWMLLSPWLPFSKCFIRIFLLGHRPAEVFPIHSHGFLPGHQIGPALVPEHMPPPASTDGHAR